MNDTTQPLTIDTAPLCSGLGQFHSNEPTAQDRKPYTTLTWPAIKAMVDAPQHVDKGTAQWLIPSTLLSREFKRQEQEGQFWALWADLDKTPKPIAEVYDALVCRIVGNADFELYTSRSATPDCPKARILVPLGKPLSGADWMLAQEVFNDQLEANGCAPDRASEHAAQLMYLPNRGALYTTRSERNGIYFDPTTVWAEKIETKRQEIEQAEALQAASREAARLRRESRKDEGGRDIVAAWNDAYPVEEILIMKDYDMRRGKFRHPASESGSYSATVRDGRVHSLSEKDPLYTSGHNGNIGAHDSFGAFVVLFHQGDTEAALKDAGDNWLKIDGEPWNKAVQREWAQSPENRADRTDLGNVAVLARQVAGNLRFVTELKTWIWWDGERWTPDKARTLTQKAAAGVGEHYRKLADDQRQKSKIEGLEPADRKRLEKVADSFEAWATHCRNKRGLDAMLGLAQSDSRFALPANELDKDPFLFGVKNGVIDLRTGHLRAAGREDYVTKGSAIVFDPEAKAPRWGQFIAEITGSPAPDVPTVGRCRPDMAKYLQKALGYAMTGCTNEHKMFMAIGEGSNGKSILLDVVQKIMGDYCVNIQPEVLMVGKGQRDSESASPSIRRLAGVRLAISSESKDGQRLDEAMVKRQTGGGFMTARGMQENTFQFEITHKLWLMTNHTPALDHVGEAIKARLHLIPFEMRWNRPGHTDHDSRLPDGDKHLEAKLQAESEGILAWMVAGAVCYIREGLEPPEDVKRMTRNYLAEQDVFGLWLNDHEICPPELGTPSTVLFTSYENRCYDNGQSLASVGTVKGFAMRLQKRGIESTRKSNATFYGLRQKTDSTLNSDLF